MKSEAFPWETARLAVAVLTALAHDRNVEAVDLIAECPDQALLAGFFAALLVRNGTDFAKTLGVDFDAWLQTVGRFAATEGR